MTRIPLPSKKQIEDITDIEYLIDLQDSFECDVEKIRIELEFVDGDKEWFSRAKGALIVRQIALKYINKRIEWLQDDPENNSINDRFIKIEKDKIKLKNRLLLTLEQTSYFHKFKTMARKMLPEETFNAICEQVTIEHMKAIENAVNEVG